MKYVNLSYKKVCRTIIYTEVDAIAEKDVCDRILTLAKLPQSAYVVAANVHVVMTAYWNSVYQKVLSTAAIVTPDGMPLVIGMRLLGVKGQSRVYGPDLMLSICDRAATEAIPIYLYGSTSVTLKRLSEKLTKDYPKLKIAGNHSPPFRALTEQEETADIERIRQSGAAVVFVGLGCPKQEEWMYRQLGKLDAVMIGVGAAFSFHSGDVAQAPRWMMKLSLEWLFRLIKEPKRLWSRYLLTNTSFVGLFFVQLLKHYFSNITRLSSSTSTSPE